MFVYLIYFIGAIAVGKTSVLKKMKEIKPDWIILKEPLKEIENITLASGEQANLLKNFYDEPSSDTAYILQESDYV